MRDDGWSAETAATAIRAQLRRLEEIQKSLKQGLGSLEVKVYDTVPTLVHFQINDEITLGFLLTVSSAHQAPMVRVPKSRAPNDLWERLEANWNKCWQIAEEWPPKSVPTGSNSP